MQRTLNVVDAIMGTGKTTAMIRYINESAPEKRFIFCTPYLDQVTRVSTECSGKSFVMPDDTFVTKTQDIKILIRENLNIATTHSLFLLFDDEIRDLIQERDYTLIVDEAMDVLDMYEITKYDASTIINKYCDTEEDGMLTWRVQEYKGEFEDYKRDIDAGIIYRHKKNYLIKMAPIESFEVFSDVFVMTYLFDKQIQNTYFDIYGWDYKYWYVGGSSHQEYYLTDTPVTYCIPDYSTLITIKNHTNGSTVDTQGFALSKEWYKKRLQEDNNIDIIQMKRHMRTFFQINGSDDISKNMWTMFKDYRKQMSGARYSKGFVRVNAKASNEYRHKDVLAYPVNRYINPNLASFISSRGGTVSNNGFALTEMLQWIWRSAIRDGKPIKIYIPSKRMCRLLTDWLDSLK